jgi:hypothetical protein
MTTVAAPCTPPALTTNTGSTAMMSADFTQFLRDFAEELYYRAAGAKSRDERMAIKGVQHSLERALLKHGPAPKTFPRPDDCPVSGCGFEPGKAYAGQYPCQLNWAGDARSQIEYLRGCALRR